MMKPKAQQEKVKGDKVSGPRKRKTSRSSSYRSDPLTCNEADVDTILSNGEST
jgi:hypothetical protein